MQPKTVISSLLIFIILGIFFSGCEKEGEEDVKNGSLQKPTVPRADNAVIFSGYHRLLLTWKNNDPNIVLAKIYWNTDSIIHPITSGTDSVKIFINNLEEGEYKLEIYTFDKDQNRSGKVLRTGYVYGDDFISNLSVSTIADITVTSENVLKIKWDTNPISAIGTEVEYTNKEGKTSMRFFERSEQIVEIADIAEAAEGTIRYRTLFAPNDQAIDILHSPYSTSKYLNRYAFFESLPGWKFRCKVMVEEKTIEDYGGMLSFKEKMDEAMVKASAKFQVPGLNDEGDNQTHFYAIEILPFSGRSSQYTTQRWLDDLSLDIMLVVNDNAASNDDSWGWRRTPYLTLGHDYAGLFGSNAVDALLHEFGHTRGMYDLYLGEVTAARNSISGQPYESERCIMNYPYGETIWSEFSRFIINASGANRVAAMYWNFFPDVFKVNVQYRDGVPASGARLNFYPVIQTSSGNMVRENDVVQYRTSLGESGNYIFNPPNPFAINQVPSNNIYNFLVEVTFTVSDTEYKEYSWMPMNHALIAGSKGLPYELNITLSK